MQIDRMLRCSVFDARNRFRGYISRPTSVSATDRWLGLGDATITLPADEAAVTALLAPGARVGIEVVEQDAAHDPTLGWKAVDTVMTGAVRNPRGDLMPGGTVTVSVQDDWRLLQNTLARIVFGPDPFTPTVDTGNITPTSLSDRAQTVAVAGETTAPGTIAGLSGRMPWTPPDVPAGPLAAESAVIYLLERNVIERRRAMFSDVNRWLTPNDLGRGGDVRDILPQPRFDTVESLVVPLLQVGGLGLRVVQVLLPNPNSVAGFQFEIFEPKTWAQVFTPESGFVVGGTWSINSPTANDVIVGGPGEEAARAFRRYADEDLAQLYQDLIEVFRDETGAPVSWPDTITDDTLKVEMYYHLQPDVLPDRLAAFEAALAAGGVDVLTGAAPTSGVAPDLSESEGFRWGGDSGFHTGDTITIAPSSTANLPDSIDFTDQITSTTFTQSKDGLSIVPSVGTDTSDPNVQLALAIRALANANQRKSTTR